MSDPQPVDSDMAELAADGFVIAVGTGLTGEPLYAITPAGEAHLRSLLPGLPGPLRQCRLCGCTDANCAQCVIRTGVPCHWVENDLCSACAGDDEAALDALENALVEYDEQGALFGTSGAGAHFLARFLLDKGYRLTAEPRR